jgi:hypothetical protein
VANSQPREKSPKNPTDCLPADPVATKTAPATIPIAPVAFPPKVATLLCSEQECPNGHRWAPTVAIAACPGCKAPVLALRMEQCPTCNEPPARLRLRCDHVALGGGIVAICKGAAAPPQMAPEVTMIEMEHSHAAAAEASATKAVIVTNPNRNSNPPND